MWLNWTTSISALNSIGGFMSRTSTDLRALEYYFMHFWRLGYSLKSLLESKLLLFGDYRFGSILELLMSWATWWLIGALCTNIIANYSLFGFIFLLPVGAWLKYLRSQYYLNVLVMYSASNGCYVTRAFSSTLRILVASLTGNLYGQRFYLNNSFPCACFTHPLSQVNHVQVKVQQCILVILLRK